MSCPIQIKENSVVKSLKSIFGENNDLITLIVETTDGTKFNSDFQKWAKEHYNHELDFDTNDKVNETVKAIRDYHNYLHPDVNYSTTIQNDATNVAHFGYTSVTAREKGKQIVVDKLLNIKHQLEHDFHEKPEGSKKVYFADAVTSVIENIITERISNKTNMSIDDVYDIIDSNNAIEQLENILGNSTEQDKNVLALYKEMLNNREEYFGQVFNDSRLGDIRFKNNDNFEDDNQAVEIAEQETDDDTDSESVNTDEDTNGTERDNSINQLNNKDGQYNNFMTHVGMSVRSYIGSLRKCNTTKKIDDEYDYNTSNELGIAEAMDINQVMTVLYSNIDFTNVSDMIQSIENIANNIPGMEGLIQMSDYLKTNEDFAYEVYRTFAKVAISKLETIADGNTIKSVLSNRRADKLTSLRFEYLNSAKTTSILLDDLNSREIYNNLKTEIDAYTQAINILNQVKQNEDIIEEADRELLYQESDNKLDKIINELANQFKRYYPTIESSFIANYIKNNNDGDIIANMNNLSTILKNTIDAGYKTQLNYYSQQAELRKAYVHNKALDARKAEGELIKASDYINLTPYYNNAYIDSSTQSAAFALANELVKYSPVKVELNSRNVHGNLSSDIINNSMITNVINTLKSTIALENFGKYKSQSRQYDFSNIMIEHKDENGNIINYGLFTLDEDSQDFIPTSYASELIKARLFSGASDMTSSKNVLYSEMSKGDYIATSFINYFNTEANYNLTSQGHDIQFANYFMRIPSDAPKNFIMVAPRYSTKETAIGKNDGLFVITNKVEADREINKRINELPTLDDDYLNDDSLCLRRSLSQAVSNITSDNIGNITIPNKIYINEKNTKIGDEVSINCIYTNVDGIETQYILAGTLGKDNGKLILEKPTFQGFAGSTKSSELVRSLEKHYQKELIKNGTIKREINTNHPIYKQLHNVFVQEITDAATALNHIFKCGPDGKVCVDNEGKPIFREGFGDNKETIRKLYATYHNNGKHIIENGKLTGKVFHSDRFIITKLNDKGQAVTTNYGENIIKEAFDFLYGGAKDSYIHFINSAKGIKVTLTDNQEAKIQEQLINFINDYINDTQSRLNEFSDFIDKRLNNDDNITDFALNYYLQYINFNDLFEGDTKFYKNTQTFLKRAKEAQGSGVPYGIVNYNEALDAQKTPITHRLNTTPFIHIKPDGTQEEVIVGLYNRFNAVTIKNTVRTSPEAAVKGINGAKKDGILVEQLTNIFEKEGLNKKEAVDSARNMMGGYQNTTVNDAQSYITFEEWIRRITARGQLAKYKPLIDAIYDESKPVNALVIKEFVQVQKNFYYDQYYSNEFGMFAPRQIKNAEFVLVPRFIKGTQLEQVYNLMKDNDIDQLNTEETSKAGKANILSIWDNEGNITQENIDDFNANAERSKELFNYNYLYTQQETPQHVDDKNKAAIQIMKKIVDNIPPTSSLYEVKQHFNRLYVANIKSSFQDLMKELTLELDKNGNLKLDEAGNIQGLDYELFFDKLKDEVARLGLDSNMMDYVTLLKDQVTNTTGNLSLPITVMPTFMSIVSSKLESIAQSVFNNRITRQTLPGFHAAQITNIGFKAKDSSVIYKLKSAGIGRNLKDNLSEDEYNKLSIKNRMYYTKTKGNIGTSKELHYHPNGEKYIEVLLPKSNFSFYKDENGYTKSDEELLKELQDAKLDKIIGYRIPTEGKQSIAIMKVVGFVDDALGSTIVVPDDWVSQTGSDFDIDSVYGIQFNSKLDNITHKIKKVDYIRNLTEQAYFNYLRSRIGHIPTKVGKEIEALKTNIEESRSERFNELRDKETELYHSLSDDTRNKIKELQNTSKNKNTKRENYSEQNTNVINGLNDYLANNELDEEEINKIQEFIDLRNQINDFINNSTKEDQAEFAKNKADILAERLRKIEALAKKNNLLSYNEFKELSLEDANTTEARNNEILQSMLDILSSDESLEENLSRSNFDDIINARDEVIDSNVKAVRDARSPYNFLDQADYQEDVMSGAKLKAFSVTRDTFVSVCNTVRPYINGSNIVNIQYYKKDGYNLKNLKKSFDKVEIYNKGTENEYYVVTHDTFGWSKDNKNVAGKILTAYSSQTTAHILDAVKEGSIPNVNDFTFAVYKCFPDIGSDYKTGVSFIMQPGIKYLVDAYNSTKSIYSNNYAKPFNLAFRNITEQILTLANIQFNKKDNINILVEKLQPFNKQLAKLFDCSNDEYKITINPLDTDVLNISGAKYKDRLNQNGIFAGNSPIEEMNRLLFDLGVLLQYNRLSSLANSIGEYARVCNPDKFGAKQTIFATNDVFDKIIDIQSRLFQPLYTKENKNDDTEASKSFLEAIYPGITGNLENFITSNGEDSKYPSLNAFLKYATAVSIKINRQLFETQSKAFRDQINELRKAFTDTKVMTEKTYKDFQNYILNYLYNNTNAVSKQLVWSKDGFDYKNDTDLEAERSRIYGYGKTADLRVPNKEGNMVEFTVKDINNPTEEEVNQFLTFSPAQKITWIQSNFDNSRLFSYIRTTLFNEREYRKNKAGAQTIEFVDSNANIEAIYDAFNKAFFNNNPLIASAAFDIVKYAFAVEGFRMKRNGVSKMISNSVLKIDENQPNTNIVKELMQSISSITGRNININNLINNFVRSHSNIQQIATKNVEKVGKNNFELSRTSYGIIALDINNTHDLELADKYKFIYNDKTEKQIYANQYVNLRFGKKNDLYKIRLQGTKIIAYPLSKLEEAENSKWSVNIQNNYGYYDEDFYNAIIDDWFGTTDNSISLSSIIGKYTETIDEHKFKNKNTIAKQLVAKPFNINDKNTNYTGGFEDVINKVTKYFAENPKGKLYLRSGALAKFITHNGILNGSTQTINDKEYDIQKVDFSKYNRAYISGKEALNRQIKEKDPQIVDIIERARQTGYTVTDVFAITPHIDQNIDIDETNEDDNVDTNTILNSSVTELGVGSMKAMRRRALSENDIEANKALNRLKDKAITATESSVKLNLNEVVPVTAEYVKGTVDKILNDLQYFIMDDSGKYHSIAEEDTINLIRNNKDERKRFLKTLLDARAFVRNYRMINELDISSEDEGLRSNLNKIKQSIDSLQNSTIINQAEELFAKDYLAKLSDNPLIQSDIISILDGYHSAGAFDAWVNDLQETSNPLLQIITKEVMGDIRSNELLAHKRVNDFKTALNKIKEEAKKAGVNIDYSHIIDDYGKFIQDYNQAFIDKINELRTNMSNTKIEYGDGSLEYLKAKFEYDKFKLNHINQRLVDDYYQTKLSLEKNMIDHFGTIYSEYNKLISKRNQILSHAINGILDEQYQEELHKIKKDIDNLTNRFFYNEVTKEFEEKRSVQDPNNPYKDKTRILRSIESATALRDYLRDMKQLRDTYFTQDAKFGFDEELEKNLDIISNYEQRDSNGKPTVPIAELMKHDDYVKAKSWIDQNARYVITPEVNKFINDAFAVFRENKKGGTVLTSIAKIREAYDNQGVIDGTKFTNEDIEKLRTETLARYNIKEGQPYSDRILISNAPTNGDIFKNSFYLGMKSNGIPNQDYLKYVNEINSILVKYYEQGTKTLHTEEISEEDLNKLDKLYDTIEELKKTVDGTNGKAIKAYIEQNVDFITNDKVYQEQKNLAALKGSRYLIKWQSVFERVEQNKDGSYEVVPNRRVFGYAVPKGYKADGTGNNFMVDKKKTDALHVIQNYTNRTKTQYYFNKYKEMRAKGDKEFNTWFNQNHIYNPYTHNYEPLDCWTKLEINPIADDGKFETIGEWVPNYNQVQSRPKDGKDNKGKPDGSIDVLNHNYKENTTLENNFKANGRNLSNSYLYTGNENELKDNTNYVNTKTLNNYERQVRDLFKSTLYQYANTAAAKNYLNQGFMASRRKEEAIDKKFLAKEAAKFVGWIDTATGKEAWYEDIDYAKDKTIDMPLMYLLKSKDSIDINYTKPKQEENETNEDYAKRLQEYTNKRKADEANNLEIHKNLLDTNWESVMEDYITKAMHFNAIQDNKYMLFYAKNMLDKLRVYVKNEGFNNLQKDATMSTDEENRYVTRKDTRLQEQYVNWLRRLVYDQWKKPNNKLTRAANLMQSMTSAKFMMLNITGGIANVTAGETQILGEAFAKEYFGTKLWTKGISIWNQGLPSFIADMNSDKASSLQSALVKFFNVVEFDEYTGVVHVDNLNKKLEQVRDFAYSPQSSGEHFMQNGAMFSMMMGHRLCVNNDNASTGRLSYTVKNEAEYMRDAEEKALLSILDDKLKEQYRKYKEIELKDPNSKKEYAWFRKNIVTDFVNTLDNEYKTKFIDKRREYQKQAKEEFNNDELHPTLYSQFELTPDGELGFKDDSILTQMGEDAYQLLGRFKDRVISVNKKIHGVYDRLGAAKWEAYWWGGLVMQYHKHIYPGIMKRYRRQGYFNEERGTIEKGCYAAIKDFLALPLRKQAFIKKLQAENNISDSNIQVAQGIQNIIQNYVDFALNIRTNWNIIPENDRANIKRALGDMLGVMSAICLAIGLQVAAGGDDKEHGILYNLFMYESDRLASESAMYTIPGLMSEGAKLWSSPVAVESGLSDMFNSAGFIAQYMIQGDDFDPYYQTGLYAGENKLEVKLKRQIPMYHGIDMVNRLQRSNKYYKLDKNMLSIIPIKDIADYIRH